MSYLGSEQVGKMFLGNEEIAKAYLGSELVYDNSGGSSIPEGYTPLTYVEFTCSQYINTGYYANPNTHIEIDMQFVENGNATNTSAKHVWIGCYDNTVGAFFSNFGSGSIQYGTIYYWFEKPFVNNTWSALYSDNIYNRDIWIYDNNTVVFQGVARATETKTTTQDGALLLGARKNSGSDIDVFNRHNLRVWRFQIYEGETLLHDWKPYNDGTDNGLYDLITNTFLKSATDTGLAGA